MRLSRRRSESRGSRFPWAPVRRWLLYIGALAVAFGGGYLVAAEWIFSAPGTTAVPEELVVVPDVRGETLERAESSLRPLDLVPRVTHRIREPRRPEGTVLSQRPLAGQLAAPGTQVHLGVSTREESAMVPGLRGLTESQALGVLRELGFDTEVRQRASSVRKGEVVGTEPEAGTRLSLPATVGLVVSEGPAVSEVPELVGRHAGDVQELLRAADLELGAVEFDRRAVAAPGRVIGQSPPAGYALRTGGAVSVRVAGTREDWRPPLRDTIDARER